MLELFGMFVFALLPIIWLVIEEILRSRKEGIPTPSDWFIVRDREGSYIGGEFVETKEGRR